MSDIFREVEEDVRRERFEKLWKQYGDYAIAAVAVIVIAIAGYKFWERYENQQRLTAAARFMAAEQASTSGNGGKAASDFGDLAKSAPGGYAQVARLAQAGALLASGNRADAVALYKQIAAKDDSAIGSVARIRAGWAMVDFAPKSDVVAVLGPLTDPSNPWKQVAGEIVAYADYRSGALKQAQSEFASLAADTNAPEALRGRANAMSVFIKSGGDRNFGTVPRPAPQMVQGQAPTLQDTP